MFHFAIAPREESLFESLRGANVPRAGRCGQQQHARLRFHLCGIPVRAAGIRMSYAGPRRFFPEFPGRLFAIPRSASGIPENHDSGAALPAAPVSSAESYRAVLRDAEAALLPVIPRALFLHRSDTWLPPQQNSLPPYCTQMPLRGGLRKMGEETLSSVCCCRDEFIAGDFRRNAHAAVPGGLDAHNLALAADIYITRLRDLLRKGDHEVDFAANFEIGVSNKVQAAVTNVAGVRVQFASFCPR